MGRLVGAVAEAEGLALEGACTLPSLRPNREAGVPAAANCTSSSKRASCTPTRATVRPVGRPRRRHNRRVVHTATRTVQPVPLQLGLCQAGPAPPMGPYPTTTPLLQPLCGLTPMLTRTSTSGPSRFLRPPHTSPAPNHLSCQKPTCHCKCQRNYSRMKRAAPPLSCLQACCRHWQKSRGARQLGLRYHRVPAISGWKWPGLCLHASSKPLATWPPTQTPTWRQWPTFSRWWRGHFNDSAVARNGSYANCASRCRQRQPGHRRRHATPPTLT